MYLALAVLSLPAASAGDTLVFEAKAGVVRTDFSDRDILAASYTDYRVPQGFYKDPSPDNESVSYMNSIGVWRKGPGLELCTEDRDEARRWQHASDSNSSVHRRLLEESETDKYFEFRTEGLPPPHYVLRMRVHKCSYFDRSEYNPRAHYILNDFAGWFQGVFNVRPVRIENVREFGEYTWSRQDRRISGARVMSSFTRDQGKEIVHTLYVLDKSVEDQDFGVNVDKRRTGPIKRRELAHVTLFRLDYQVNKKFGGITLDSEAVRTIRVRDNPPEVLKK